jgi:mono/diheme cytochrome c family protein
VSQIGPPRALVLALAVAAGCRAEPPGELERALATRVKRITVGGKSDRNPLAPTEENIRKGQKDFSHYCMVCHGLDGQNTGVPFAEAMSPPVPHLSAPEVQGYSDGQLKWVIENGIFPSGMPASRGLLHDLEIWRIVLYIRHLPPAGSLGEPGVYGGTNEPASSTTTEPDRQTPQARH